MSSRTAQTEVFTIYPSVYPCVRLSVCRVMTTCLIPVDPVMERVSGNVMEFEMSSLVPATHYTVKVFAARDLAKSTATTTEFTTGD